MWEEWEDHVPLAHWFLIFRHYLVAFYFLSCPMLCSSPATAMSKQATVGISTICQRSGLFPALVESTDTVPRTGGMKISLLIMGANQISDAIYFLVEGVTEQERCNQSTSPWSSMSNICLPRSAHRWSCSRCLASPDYWASRGKTEQNMKRCISNAGGRQNLNTDLFHYSEIWSSSAFTLPVL